MGRNSWEGFAGAGWRCPQSDGHNRLSKCRAMASHETANELHSSSHISICSMSSCVSPLCLRRLCPSRSLRWFLQRAHKADRPTKKLVSALSIIHMVAIEPKAVSVPVTSLHGSLASLGAQPRNNAHDDALMCLADVEHCPHIDK
jgi:hypothetical protein